MITKMDKFTHTNHHLFLLLLSPPLVEYHITIIDIRNEENNRPCFLCSMIHRACAGSRMEKKADIIDKNNMT